MFILPDDLRDALKEPLGRLVDEQELLKRISHEEYIVSVGDLVTFTLLNNGVKPGICIVDYILKRKDYSLDMKEKIKGFDAKQIKIKNPPGTITDELWNAIELAFKKRAEGPFRIEIDGEEDLAALAAIFLAPSDATVIYGLPNKGVVVVKATTAHKRKVKEILDRM
jgi:uncharacterized protein (UPF0218 family)